MSATDLHTDSGLAPNNTPTAPIVESAVVETTVAAPSVLGYSPDDFVDDDSWAKPRPRANKRLLWLVGAMCVTLVGLGTFTLGAKLGKDSTTTSTGGSARTGLGAAFGAGGGLGGLGGAGGAGGFGGGRNRIGAGGAGGAAGATATGAAGTSQADILAGLLAGGGTAGSGAAAASSAPAVQGTVTKVDATSITVTKADGTTVVITIDNKAEIARRAKASLADVKVGDNVAAAGSTDSVGNVAATQVTVGDLKPVDDAAAATAEATTNTAPPPDTSSDLGGLLGG